LTPVTLPRTVGPEADLVNQKTLDRGRRNRQNQVSMKFPRLVGVCIFLSISMLRAQQQDVAPPNVESIIKEIEALELKQKQGKVSERNALLGAIQSAAASGSAAANFYTQAVEEVNFKGKKDKVEASIAWKKSHADLLRSKEMQTALLLHLKYLLLALQRKDLEKPETQLPAVMAYLNELIACDDLFADQKPPNEETRGLLAKPLNQSVFAQWLRLGEWLPDDKTWEGQPGNVPGILEKNVRSVMRVQKDPALVQTWDLEMKVEAARITTGRSEHQADQFNAVNRPRLQFKQAQDMIVAGQPNRALAQMITLVRTSPAHQDFPTWVAKIREMVKSVSAQTSPSPAPGTAP
jgi:hypothetical protein